MNIATHNRATERPTGLRRSRASTAKLGQKRSSRATSAESQLTPRFRTSMAGELSRLCERGLQMKVRNASGEEAVQEHKRAPWMTKEPSRTLQRRLNL